MLSLIFQSLSLMYFAREDIEGTDWQVVFTKGGQAYYYNKLTKTSKWTLPEELNTPKPLAKAEEHKDVAEDLELGEAKKRSIEQVEGSHEAEPAAKKAKGDSNQEQEQNQEGKPAQPQQTPGFPPGHPGAGVVPGFPPGHPAARGVPGFPPAMDEMDRRLVIRSKYS